MIKRLSNQKGIALIIECLIILVPLLIFYFAYLNQWGLQMRINQAEHIKNYYLNRIRLEGYLSETDMMDLQNKLDQAGFRLVKLSAPVQNPGLVGVDTSECTVGRVLRKVNIEDPAEIASATVWLKIEIQPKTGDLPEDVGPIKLTGRSLSERVSP